VFTSTIAFIDTMLDPDSALLIDDSFHDIFSKPPIFLPKGDGEVPEEVAGDQKKPDRPGEVVPSPYAFQFDPKNERWHLRFPGDKNHSFPTWDGLKMYAILLKEKGKPMTGLDLYAFLGDREVKDGRFEDAEFENDLVQKKKNRDDGLVFTFDDKIQYQQQIKQLNKTISKAEQDGAMGLVGEATRERDELVAFVRKSLDRLGKPRRLGHAPEAEKKRRAAKRVMEYALAQVRVKMPRIAEFLSKCNPNWGEESWCYRPVENIDWDF
jgi:hypothetical protein